MVMRYERVPGGGAVKGILLRFIGGRKDFCMTVLSDAAE